MNHLGTRRFGLAFPGTRTMPSRVRPGPRVTLGTAFPAFLTFRCLGANEADYGIDPWTENAARALEGFDGDAAFLRDLRPVRPAATSRRQLAIADQRLKIGTKPFEFPRRENLSDSLAEESIDHAGKRGPPGASGHCRLV